MDEIDSQDGWEEAGSENDSGAGRNDPLPLPSMFVSIFVAHPLKFDADDAFAISSLAMMPTTFPGPCISNKHITNDDENEGFMSRDG